MGGYLSLDRIFILFRYRIGYHPRVWAGISGIKKLKTFSGSGLRIILFEKYIKKLGTLRGPHSSEFLVAERMNSGSARPGLGPEDHFQLTVVRWVYGQRFWLKTLWYVWAVLFEPFTRLDNYSRCNMMNFFQTGICNGYESLHILKFIYQ